MEYRNSFENYAYLWVDDRQEFLRQFLLYGHVLTAEEIEAAGEEGVSETPPTLAQYKEQVDTYEQIFTTVEQFEVCSNMRWYIYVYMYVANLKIHGKRENEKEGVGEKERGRLYTSYT